MLVTSIFSFPTFSKGCSVGVAKSQGCMVLLCGNGLKHSRKKLQENKVEKVRLHNVSSFTFFRNFFYAICILKFVNSHISVVICIFFEFGTVSKWCIREWKHDCTCIFSHIFISLFSDSEKLRPNFKRS